MIYAIALMTIPSLSLEEAPASNRPVTHLKKEASSYETQ
jgi:hypothetical protein